MPIENQTTGTIVDYNVIGSGSIGQVYCSALPNDLDDTSNKTIDVTT